MKDTRAIGILLILFIATLCPAEGAQLVTIDSKDYTSLDTATEGYFYVKLDDSPSNVVLNFDIKFEALSFFDPNNYNMDHIAKYADFYYCCTNDNSNDDSTLKNYNYIKISASISNIEIFVDTVTAILNYSFMISKQNYKYLIVKYILQKTAESAQAKVSKKDLGKIETKTSTSTTSITTRVATSFLNGVLPVWAFALIVVVGVILIVVSIIICCCCCACCAGCCRRRKTVVNVGYVDPQPLVV